MAVISLQKSGESHKISLSKGSSDLIQTNLKWNSAIEKKGLFGSKITHADLDLACLYQLKDGSSGIVQALGNSFGSKENSPYIFLDGDDRSGSSQAGETMFLTKPSEISLAVIFAYIYQGSAQWDKTGAVITLSQSNKDDIVIDMKNTPSPHKFCVIAALKTDGTDLHVIREEKFFQSHQAVDSAYGFGLTWTTGRK